MYIQGAVLLINISGMYEYIMSVCMYAYICMYVCTYVCVFPYDNSMYSCT